MLPAAAFLLLFLAYPLGLGIWLSFTDARIGRSGNFVGIENYVWLWDDSVFWLSVFNTLLYTASPACSNSPSDSTLPSPQPAHAVQGDHPRDRADPVHRADRALGHRLLVDLRQPVLDRVLVAAQAWPDRNQYRFPRRHLERALVGDLRQHLARRAFRRHYAAGRSADGRAALRGGDDRRRRADGRSSATSPTRCSRPSSRW